MSTRREQFIGASLFIVLVLLGWTPFYLEAVRADIYDAAPFLLGGFFAILAAGLTYDAGERLFGAGKGIYVAAVLTSLPAAAIVFSEPPLLSSTSLMFITSATLWFAARGTRENPREALFFIAILSAIPLAVFGLWPPALLPLSALFIAQHKLSLKWTTVLLTALFGLSGLIAKSFLPFDLPDVIGNQPDIELSWAESTALLAPWVTFLLLALIAKTTWSRIVVVAIALLTLFHVQNAGAWVAMVGPAAPLLALAITAVVLKWFDAETEGHLRSWRWFVLPLVLVLVAFVVARIAKFDSLVIGHNHAIIGLLVAALLCAGAIKDARRWVFALHVIAAWLIGALWWHYWQDGGYAAQEPSVINIVPWLTVAMFLFVATIRLWYGRKMPRKLRAEGPRHRFDAVVFRNFANERRNEWEGAPVAVIPRDNNSVRFAIFGDVAGSEFPFASKQSGYYAYKEIIKSISARQPDFAVSTGDLALRATHLANRRLRKLLRYVTFPLIATPGNHDIVDRSVVHSQFFHALFGSDHGDITIGNVRLILINNAWGSFEDDQLKWIDGTFAKPSIAKSTLVFCHKPVFDPRENTYYGMEHRPHAEHLHALFVKHKVSAVFSGHIHSLLHTERDGVHYIISGGGGSKLKTASDTHHYLWCEATEQAVHITAHGLDKSEPLLDLKVSARA